MTDEPKKPRKTRERRTFLAPGLAPPDDAAASMVESRFEPQNPTSGDDLMAVWNLPPDAATHGKVKLLRRDFGAMSQTLLGETTVEAYSLPDMAAKWGPGEYIVQLSPSPSKLWNLRKATIRVSPEYAKAEGWSPMARLDTPPPRVASLATYAPLTDPQGPMTPVQVASLVETLLDRMEARRPAPPSQDMAGMFAMFGHFQGIQEAAEARARANMEMFMKMNRGPAVEESPWADVAREVLPSLVPVLGQIAGAIAQRSAPPALPPPLEVEEDPEPEPQEVPAVSLPLSLSERANLAPAVAMLQPWKGNILKVLDAEGPQKGAPQLLPFVPPFLVPRLALLNQLTAKHGLVILSIIDPAFCRPDMKDMLVEMVRLAEPAPKA